MSDRTLNEDPSRKEPQCYNCGTTGHQTIACPEPTRAVPAGLEAHRKRQTSSRDSIINSYNSYNNLNTGGTGNYSSTNDSGSHVGRRASGHYAGNVAGAVASQSRHANGMVVTRYPPLVSPSGPQITHYPLPPSYPTSSSSLAQANQPPPPPPPLSISPPPPPVVPPPPPPPPHDHRSVAPGAGSSVQPYHQIQSSPYRHLLPPPPPPGHEPWHYPASAPPSFQLNTPPVPYYTSQHYGPPQPDYFPQPPPGVRALPGGLPPTQHSSLPPPPPSWGHPGSSARPHLGQASPCPPPGLAAPASAPPAVPVFNRGSENSKGYSDYWRQDNKHGGNDFNGQHIGQQNGRNYQRGGSFSRGRGGHVSSGNGFNTRGSQDSAPAIATPYASSPPHSAPATFSEPVSATSSLPKRPPGIPAKPPTPITQVQGGGGFESQHKRERAGGYSGREEGSRGDFKRTRPTPAIGNGYGHGNENATAFTATTPKSLPSSISGTAEMVTRNGLHAPHNSNSHRIPGLPTKLPGGAPASLPSNPVWANRRPTQPLEKPSSSSSLAPPPGNTDNSGSIMAALSQKEDKRQEKLGSKQPEPSVSSGNLPGGAPSSLPSRPPPPYSHRVIERRDNERRDHHRDHLRDRRSRTRSSSRSCSRALPSISRARTTTRVNGKAATNELRSQSRGHSRSRSRTRSGSFQRDRYERNRGRTRSRSPSSSRDRSRSSSPLDDLELAMLGMAAPVSASGKSRSNGHRGRRRSDDSSTSNYQGSSYGSDDGGGGRKGTGRKKRLRNDNGRIPKQRRPKESSVYSRRW
ncbi:hypothetical protein SEPCBS57363_006040 [Sporothrix epigloea]|uniref:CCHC-type domain-containing protein n=1 Tax=Sporothrix epigloea TaxID=1892477 RepID=A0ABP0E0W6_9PEZI